MTEPDAAALQRALSTEQVEAFYHDLFVEDQTRHFVEMAPRPAGSGVVVDVGGGCGFFARRLQQLTARRVRVIDMDPASVRACHEAGVEASRGDALAPVPAGDEEVASFNLILHHLVADSEAETRALQVRALRAWHTHAQAVFVNEYIYQSFVARLSGWLIFQITKSRVLSALGRAAARVVPAFKANTFGVGVRFRSHDEWVELFAQAGFRVEDRRIGEAERVAPPLRVLFIRTIRRDSFLLRAKESA
jgi:hypothetical protein